MFLSQGSGLGLVSSYKENVLKAIFLLFTERKILLMKNENEASVPEFSS